MGGGSWQDEGYCKILFLDLGAFINKRLGGTRDAAQHRWSVGMVCRFQSAWLLYTYMDSGCLALDRTLTSGGSVSVGSECEDFTKAFPRAGQMLCAHCSVYLILL